MFTLEVVSTLARLEELGPEWDRLANVSGSALLSHAWFVESARAFAGDGELSIHIARDDRGVRAIAPLAIRRSGGVSRLQMLGCENYEPEAFLWDDAAALAEVCASVLRLRRPLLLSRLEDASRELVLLRCGSAGPGLPIVRPSSTQSHANPIGADCATFEARMNAKQRAELRRRRKKLEELGPVTFEALAPDQDAFLAPLDAFFSVEGGGWKRQAGTAILQNADAHRFYLGYAREAARRGLLRLFFLRLNGKVIAGQLHIQFGGRLWALKIGYDEAYANSSPGALLTHEVLRYGCEQSLLAFEHLGSAEPWQRRWPVETRDYSSLRFYPLSVRGAQALAVDALGLLRARVARLTARFATARQGAAVPGGLPIPGRA